ncbi:hypothetical protein AB6D66_00750 [Vibrio pomeroyi]|uniref:Uncharacterized protein n=1 Tax=Vibrio pomeroyi TaxID=198832 RepID=A0ABV4MQZ7_9VIBR|nr:hypothetical protein [Vibrio atlanticus]MCZ4311409.1 hypothetical protein [Vibrio atlanticus]
MAIKKRSEPRKEVEQTESAYITELGLLEEHQKRFETMIPNVHITQFNEADVIGIRKSGFVDEFEIKLSRQDFMADRKKTLDFENSGSQFKLKELESGNLIINHFWYVIPKGLVQISELPEFAGLIEISDKPLIIRHPKRLHSRKATFEERYHLAKKASDRFWSEKEKNNTQDETVCCPNTSTLGEPELFQLQSDIEVGEWNQFDTITLPLGTVKDLVEFAYSHEQPPSENKGRP